MGDHCGRILSGKITEDMVIIAVQCLQTNIGMATLGNQGDNVTCTCIISVLEWTKGS